MVLRAIRFWLIWVLTLSTCWTIATAATRYEADWTVQIEHNAQGLEAQTMRILQQRIASASAAGSRIESQVLLPAGANTFRIVVRGTTIPHLLERIMTTPPMAGWARVSDGTPERRGEGSSPYDEKGPYQIYPWTSGAPLNLLVAGGTDSRSVVSVVLVERTVAPGRSQDFLALSLLPGPREFPDLVVAGSVVPAADLAGRRHLLLPVSADPEERAAILGVMQNARAPLPSPVSIISANIRPLDNKGMESTITDRLADLRSGPITKAKLEKALGDSSPLVRRRALLLCHTRKTTPVDAVVHCLEDQDPGVVATAMESLRALGLKPSLTTLRRLLQAPCLDLARECVHGLIILGTPVAIDEAIHSLRDDDLLESCLSVIQEMHFKQALPQLSNLIRRQGGSVPVRDGALRVFMQLAPDRGKSVCLELLSDGDPVMRLAAARRLAVLKDPAGTRYLKAAAAATAGQPALRQAAAASLNDLGGAGESAPARESH